MEKKVQDDLSQKLEEVLLVLRKNLSGLRTGRPSPTLLEPITVEAYGGRCPLSQVASVSTSESRQLVVQVWDNTVVSAVEKAIRSFPGLNLNPITEGSTLRIPLPELTKERRQELTKVVKEHGENARISMRNVRRQIMDGVNQQEKSGVFSEDDAQRLKKELEKTMALKMSEVEKLLEGKEKEIMKV